MAHKKRPLALAVMLALMHFNFQEQSCEPRDQTSLK